jgi:hypothetical protein
MLRYTTTLWRGLAALLRRLGTQQCAAAGRPERRQWVRYRSGVRITCRPAVVPDTSGLLAQVNDVSFGGINLLVSRHLEQGLLLHVDLPHAPRSAPSLLACVVQVTSRLETSWELGCSFIRELTEQELRRFL